MSVEEDEFEEAPGEEYETQSEPWKKTVRERSFEELDSLILDAYQKVALMASVRDDGNELHFIVAMGMLEAARNRIILQAESERSEHGGS